MVNKKGKRFVIVSGGLVLIVIGAFIVMPIVNPRSTNEKRDETAKNQEDSRRLSPYVFSVQINKEVSRSSVMGRPEIQYEVRKINGELNTKGVVPDTFIISSSIELMNSAMSAAPGPTQNNKPTLNVYAKYNSLHHWYTVINADLYVIN